MLCLALPAAFAAGCASDSNRPTAAAANINAPGESSAAYSGRRAANVVVGNDIFWLFLADTDISFNYNLCASNNIGVVALDSNSPDATERQRVVNEIWKLKGVSQVKDETGVNTPPTPDGKNVAAR